MVFGGIFFCLKRVLYFLYKLYGGCCDAAIAFCNI